MKKNTKVIFLLGLTLFLMAPQAHGAEGVTADSSGYWSDTAPLNFNIGAGLASYAGNTGWAIQAGILNRVSDAPIFFGLDLGFNFWSANVLNSSVGATSLSLIPSLIYGFGLGNSQAVHPYVGIGAGPALLMEQRNNPVAGGPQISETRMLLQVLVKPGANFPITKEFTLNTEAAFGLLSSNFIFLPRISAVVAL